MSNTLLPCPFCGGEADVEEIPGSPFTNEPYMWAVGCEECNIGWYKETKEEAIAAWNCRADAVPVVRGKWTHGINENFRTCSACNISMGLTEGENLSRFKYCPFCGAKMEVEP